MLKEKNAFVLRIDVLFVKSLCVKPTAVQTVEVEVARFSRPCA